MSLFHTGKMCPQCGEIKPRTVVCPQCHGPVTIEDEPKPFVQRANEQIWFAGGLIAMMIVCAVGFAVASCLLWLCCWGSTGFYRVLSFGFSASDTCRKSNYDRTARLG